MKYLKKFENTDFEQEPISGVGTSILKLPYKTVEDIAYYFRYQQQDYKRISLKDRPADDTGDKGGYLTIQDVKTGKYFQTSYVVVDYDGTRWDQEGDNVIFYEVQKTQKVVTYYGHVEESLFEKKDLSDFSQEPIDGSQKRDVILLPREDVCDVPYGCNAYDQPYTWIDDRILNQDYEKGYADEEVIIKNNDNGKFYKSSYSKSRDGVDWDNIKYADDDEGQNTPLVEFTEVFRTQVVTYVYK